MIEIVFSYETQYGNFCDALYFEEGQVPSDSEIEAMKLQRLNNWLAVVTPKTEPDPVEE